MRGKNNNEAFLSYSDDLLVGESAIGLNSQRTSINMTTSPVFLNENENKTFFVTYEFGAISKFDSSK